MPKINFMLKYYWLLYYFLLVAAVSLSIAPDKQIKGTHHFQQVKNDILYANLKMCVFIL